MPTANEMFEQRLEMTDAPIGTLMLCEGSKWLVHVWKTWNIPLSET